MGNKKKKYVSPLVEELGFESEVRLLAGSVRQKRVTLGAQFEDLDSEDFYDGMPPATTTTAARTTMIAFHFPDNFIEFILPLIC